MAKATELPILAFESAGQWRTWLTKQHAKSEGVWLRIFKKQSDTPSVNYADALDAALCYGWIDSQKRAYDADSWLQRFTPRKAGSGWSKINVQHAEQLIAAGQMRAPGLAHVDAAKADGRWERSYDSGRTMTFPDDFLTALHKYKRATKFFESLDRANLYAIGYRLQTAKTSVTRARQMAAILEKLKKGERWHE